MGISTGGPGAKPGPGVKTAATWPSAASPAGKRRSDRSPGAALCGHLERAPPQTPTPGEASEELGAETCAVKEAVNRAPIRSADTGGAGTVLLGVMRSRVCAAFTRNHAERYALYLLREGLHSPTSSHTPSRPPAGAHTSAWARAQARGILRCRIPFPPSLPGTAGRGSRGC